MPFTELASVTEAGLKKLATEVAGIRPIETRAFRFNTSSLDVAAKPIGLIKEVGDWAKKSKVLYVFQTQAAKDEVDMLFELCEIAKEEKTGGGSYARAFAPSQTLYVGGSKSMKARFGQHLGFGAKRTYAMQLAHWAHPLDVEVELVVARYDSSLSDEVLGALEDALWNQRRPMFGRQGRR